MRCEARSDRQPARVRPPCGVPAPHRHARPRIAHHWDRVSRLRSLGRVPTRRCWAEEPRCEAVPAPVSRHTTWQALSDIAQLGGGTFHLRQCHFGDRLRVVVRRRHCAGRSAGAPRHVDQLWPNMLSRTVRRSMSPEDVPEAVAWARLRLDACQMAGQELSQPVRAIDRPVRAVLRRATVHLTRVEFVELPLDSDTAGPHELGLQSGQRVFYTRRTFQP
jgi:hypothetical protein